MNPRETPWGAGDPMSKEIWSGKGDTRMILFLLMAYFFCVEDSALSGHKMDQSSTMVSIKSDPIVQYFPIC